MGLNPLVSQHRKKEATVLHILMAKWLTPYVQLKTAQWMVWNDHFPTLNFDFLSCQLQLFTQKHGM